MGEGGAGGAVTPKEAAAAPRMGREPACTRAVAAHALGGHSPSCMHLRSPASPPSCGRCPGDITCLLSSVRPHLSVCFPCCCHRDTLESKPKHALLSLRPSEWPVMGRTESGLCLQNESPPERVLPTPLAPFYELLGHIRRWPAHTLLNIPHLSE